MALISEEYNDKVGFVTILLGMENDRNTAIQITDSVNAQFLTIDANESVIMSFGKHFESGYIPESILIDNDGNIIESIVGGDPDVYRTAIENALNR